MQRKNKNEGNILLVANWKSDVGYAWWLMENFWTTTAEHFEKQGMDSFLYYPEITAIPETIAATNIKTTELNFSIHNPANLLNIYRHIKQHSIRYIYLSDYPSYSWFYFLLKTFGVKKIVVHDHTPGERTEPTGALKIIKKIIQRIPLVTADHVIAVTEFVHQRHLKVSCIPEVKCSVASNGIYPIDLKSADPYYAHKQFNISLDKKIVVTTGRASYYKGIDFFIQCADELINNQNIDQLHFLFCGDGPDIAAFKSLCKDYNLEQHFTFAGKRSDVKKILPSCTIGLHAATGEVGYSLSILEYMSAGLVTLVPDNPSTSLATTDQQNGFLYKSRNLSSAVTLIKLALDDSIVEKIKKNAIETVNTHFHITNTNKQLVKILQPIYTSS